VKEIPVQRSVGKPHNRMTRLCDAATKAMDAHPEWSDDVRAIVLLHDEEEGGVQLHNYPGDDDEAAEKEGLVDLVMHLKALLRRHGFDVHVTSREKHWK
jgi:hypothetical protein